MGIEVVDDDYQTEEDKEVQKLMETGKTVKRKIRTGKYVVYVEMVKNCRVL